MATAFENLAARMVTDLIRELNLTPEQAAGIVGNGAAESGLRAIQEKNPTSGRGGWGFFQWTGPRRTAFEKWAKTEGLALDSFEANVGFLIHELKTTQKKSLEKLKLTKTAKAAAETFGYWYERFAGYEKIEGNPNYENRVRLAERALALYEASEKPPPAPTSPVTLADLAKTVAGLSQTVADLAVQVAKLTKGQT